MTSVGLNASFYSKCQNMNAELAIYQQKRIADYLKKRGIADEGLMFEMGEHIKALVVAGLKAGSNFDVAYTSAISELKARESLAGFPAPSYACTRNIYTDKMLPLVLGIMAVMIALTGFYLQYYRLPFGSLLLISGGVLLTGVGALAVINFLIPVMTAAAANRAARKNAMISS